VKEKRPHYGEFFNKTFEEVIRDGRAYRLFTPEDDFPAVRVYWIDPVLYGFRDE